MSARTIIVIILALSCGATAAVGVSQYRSLLPGPTADVEVKTVAVLVANTNVARGNVLGADQLTIEQWPENKVREGALSKQEQAIDRTAVVKLFAGDFVLERKLAPEGAGRGMSAMIPTGMRAFTIKTSHVSAGGGFVLPGNHVDVLLTTTSRVDDGTGGAATTTLLQNVQILAVAQLMDAPDTNKVDPKATKDVTLLVTPNQAAKLDLGMNKGMLHLSLRNSEDSLEADTRPATLAQLRFSQDRALPSSKFLNNALTGFATILSAGQRRPAGELQQQSHEEVVSELEPVEPVRREARIRTLRGMNRGMVHVEIIGGKTQNYQNTLN
jgi:pilus assembly protein CpaB